MGGLSTWTYLRTASTVLNAYSQVKAGKERQQEQFRYAQQLETQANASQAESQREALVERKKSQYMASRARAVAGASGAGVSDPSVVNALTDIDTQGEVNYLNALYSGNTEAQSLRAGAATARRTGNAEKTAGQYQAFSTGVSAFTGLSDSTSWYKKYGAKK